VLTIHGLSSLQFTVLVILFGLKPDLFTAGVLAEHAGTTLGGLTEAIRELESRGYTQRRRVVPIDRNDVIVITAAGCDLADRSVNDYLVAAAAAARHVKSAKQQDLRTAYIQLRRGLCERSQSSHGGRL